jgi:hypothetical protein
MVVLKVDKELGKESEEEGFVPEEGSSGSKRKRERTLL